MRQPAPAEPVPATQEQTASGTRRASGQRSGPDPTRRTRICCSSDHRLDGGDAERPDGFGGAASARTDVRASYQMVDGQSKALKIDVLRRARARSAAAEVSSSLITARPSSRKARARGRARPARGRRGLRSGRRSGRPARFDVLLTVDSSRPTRSPRDGSRRRRPSRTIRKIVWRCRRAVDAGVGPEGDAHACLHGLRPVVPLRLPDGPLLVDVLARDVQVVRHAPGYSRRCRCRRRGRARSFIRRMPSSSIRVPCSIESKPARVASLMLCVPCLRGDAAPQPMRLLRRDAQLFVGELGRAGDVAAREHAATRRDLDQVTPAGHVRAESGGGSWSAAVGDREIALQRVKSTRTFGG